MVAFKVQLVIVCSIIILLCFLKFHERTKTSSKVTIKRRVTETEVALMNRSKTEEAGIRDIDDFTDPNKWTILLTVNNGFYDMFENWWWHFRKLNITVNVTVIAEDGLAFVKLKKNYAMHQVYIVKSWILNISRALDFDSDGYKMMVSARPLYIKEYLQRSSNILIADIDTVLLKNPFQYFKGNFDIWAQNVSGFKDLVCPGFMAVKSNTKTVEAMKLWHLKLSEKLQRNLRPFNEVIRKQTPKMKIKFLDEYKFVGGPTFSSMSKKQRSNVVMLHATYCLGHKEKLKCFKKWKLWAFG